MPHNDITLRPARGDDLPALLALEAQFPGDRMSARQFRRHLHSASARMQVACDGDALIGASLLFFRCGSDCARLYSLVVAAAARSEEHTSELQSLMRISYAVFCLQKKKHAASDN